MRRPSTAGYHRVAHWWSHNNLGTPIKIAILIAVIIALILNSEWLVPMAIVLGTVYLVYFAVRAVVVGSHRSTTAAPAQPVVATAVPTSTRRGQRPGRREPARRVDWRQQARDFLSHKPAGQRLTELTGSFLMSAIVCSVLSLMILVAGGRNLDTSVDTWTFYAWLTMTSIAASWLILGLAKFWEGTEGDEVLRRFVMMVAGLAIGVAAYGACDLLMIRLTNREMFNVLELPIPRGMYAADGTPVITAFLAYFATLFVALRWWQQVDPLRKTRFSLFATTVCVLVAMLIPWQIPWGFLLAATVAVSIQLSAPWMNSSDRARVRRQAWEA